MQEKERSGHTDKSKFAALQRMEVTQDHETGFTFCPRCGYVVMEVNPNSCCAACGYRFCASCSE